MPLLNRTLLALSLLGVLTLTACDTTDPGVDPGPDPGPTPTPLTVAFDWSGRIQVIEDCEIGGSNTGDFRFEVEVLADIDGTSIRRTVLNRDFAANTGTSVGVSSSDTEFTVPAGVDAAFDVSFYAVERDATSADDLDVTDTNRHTVSNGVFSPTGSQRITLSDGSNCRVELRYSAASS